jgi:hypothetical protein
VASRALCLGAGFLRELQEPLALELPEDLVRNADSWHFYSSTELQSLEMKELIYQAFQ